MITAQDLTQTFSIKYGPAEALDWGPRVRLRFGYFSPDDWYEALVSKLVHSETTWLDVGCGQRLFRSNPRLASLLSSRCRLLVGVDPDETIEDNPFVHQKVRASIADYRPSTSFDLITLRMVAEHITDPEPTVRSLARIIKPGGKIVIYTVFKYSPIPLLTFLVPFPWHHAVKRLLWGTSPRDTFPVAYRMNTRSRLRRLFERAHFREVWFAYLDDCRTFGRFRSANWFELAVWALLQRLGVHYPELCILGLYEKQ